MQTAPALMAVTKPTSAKGPWFLLTIQVLNLYNPLSPHKVIPHWIFFFLSGIPVSRRHYCLPSPLHALAPTAEFSCPKPTTSKVSHKENACLKVLLPTLAHPISGLALTTSSEETLMVSNSWHGHISFLSQVRQVIWSVRPWLKWCSKKPVMYTYLASKWC